MALEFEIRIPEKLGNIPLRSRVEIINTQDIPPISHQSIAKVRAQEPGSSGNQDTIAPHFCPTMLIPLPQRYRRSAYTYFGIINASGYTSSSFAGSIFSSV